MLKLSLEISNTRTVVRMMIFMEGKPTDKVVFKRYSSFQVLNRESSKNLKPNVHR